MPKINHLGLKIASLLCGISLWFYVVSGREYQITVEAPLRFVNLPAQLAISSRPPSTLPVQLSGKALELIRLRTTDSSCWIELDLRDALLGSQSLPLSEASFQAPGFSGVKYLGAQGLAGIEFEVDARVERRVPVKLRAQLKPAPGYALIGEPQLEPAELVLSGARNTLTRVFEIPTRDEEITGLKWDNALPVALDLSGLPPHVQVADSMVQMRVRVEPLERRVFTGVTVQLIGNFDRRIYSLSPATATVEITGGKNVLSQTQQSDLQLFIEYTRFAIEDADSLSPTVRIRRPVQSWRVHPDKFKLVTRPLPLPRLDSAGQEGTL